MDDKKNKGNGEGMGWYLKQTERVEPGQTSGTVESGTVNMYGGVKRPKCSQPIGGTAYQLIVWVLISFGGGGWWFGLVWW